MLPKHSSMVSRSCALPTSTSCSYYSGTINRYYWSALVAGGIVVIGMIWVLHIRHTTITNVSLERLSVTDLCEFVTSGEGCVVYQNDGVALLDREIL